MYHIAHGCATRKKWLQIRSTRRKSLAGFWVRNRSQSISYAGFCHPSSSGFFAIVYRKWALRLGLWAALSGSIASRKCVLSSLCCTTKYNKVSLFGSLFSRGNCAASLFAFIQSYGLSPYLLYSD